MAFLSHRSNGMPELALLMNVLFQEQHDFDICFLGRDISEQVRNSMVDMGISSNIMKSPSPKCYLIFCDMTIQLGKRRTLTPSETYPIPFGTCICSYVETMKIYILVNRGQNIYFQPQQIFEKAKEKKKKKREGGGVGGGLVRGFSRGGRTWFSMFCITFCKLLARNIANLIA